MYRCNDCDHEFEDPEFICEREMIDYGIGREWVTLSEGEACPYCESYNIKEVSDEDDDVAEPDETLGVGLQQAEGTEDDGQRVA